MSWNDFLLRIRALIFRRRVEHELHDELSTHLEMEIEHRIRQGMPPEDARRSALAAFGGASQVAEQCRDERGTRWMEDFGRDVHYAARQLLKHRSFFSIAAVTLALAIGANTAIFSVVNSILLRPLPFSRSDRLVEISGSLRQRAALVLLRDSSRSADYGAYTRRDHQLNFTEQGEPVRLTGRSVTTNLFSILGVTPMLGRTFEPGQETPGRDGAVILSHSLWQTRFRSDPGVVGRWIQLGDTERQVVAVMPAAFRFPSPETEFWIPLTIDERNDGQYWWEYTLTLVGRLREGATAAHAQSEMETVIPRIRAGFPWKMWPDWGADARVISMQEAQTRDVRTRLLILLASVGLVLVIACANVANLLLSRAANRQKEIAMRVALGAGRMRVVRQLLTESVVLAVVGAGLGLLLAVAGLNLLKSWLPANTPRLAEVAIDPTVLAFTASLAVLTGIVFGLAPALALSKGDDQWGLKTGDRSAGHPSRQLLPAALVVFEIAIAVVVVAGAGLLGKSLWTLVNVDPGFQPGHILTARITPNESFCRQESGCEGFYGELLTRTRALPGVRDAAAVNVLPLEGRVAGFAAEFEDHPVLPGSAAPSPWLSGVTPRYFETMRIPLLRGRLFSDADTVTAPRVALVSEETARRWWPNQDPIGKRVRPTWMKEHWYSVVGVVGNTREAGLGAAPEWLAGHVYVPRMGRTFSDPPRDEPRDPHPADIRRLELNRYVPVTRLRTMEEVVSSSLAMPRFTTTGLLIGLGGAAAASRVLRSFLFQTSATDPATFAAVAILLLAVATLAGYLPARRAARLDPLIALRNE
jgi:predicted permease